MAIKQRLLKFVSQELLAAFISKAMVLVVNLFWKYHCQRDIVEGRNVAAPALVRQLNDQKVGLNFPSLCGCPV